MKIRIFPGIVALVVIAACDNAQQGAAVQASPSATVPAEDSAHQYSAGCVMAGDTFGYAAVSVSGLPESRWVLDADFGVGKDSSFYVTLSQQELGHFELQFLTPRIREYPTVGRHGWVAGSEDNSFQAKLTVFDDSTDVYATYSLNSGEWTIHDSGPGGVCGEFDLSWTAARTRSPKVRTTGVFRAAQNQYTDKPTAGQR